MNRSLSALSSMFSNVKMIVGTLESHIILITGTLSTCPAMELNGPDYINLSPSSELSGMDANKRSQKNTSRCTEEIKCVAELLHVADPIYQVSLPFLQKSYLAKSIFPYIASRNYTGVISTGSAGTLIFNSLEGVVSSTSI